MAGLDNVTFEVQFQQESKTKFETTITIFDERIECPKTPNIKFKDLDQILINNSEEHKYRKRSFALSDSFFVWNFVAADPQKRNQILFEILSRFPPNRTNQAHWKTIQSAIGEIEFVLNIDHNEANELSVLSEATSFADSEDDDMLTITKSASGNPSVSPGPHSPGSLFSAESVEFIRQREISKSEHKKPKKGRGVKTVLDTAKLRLERQSIAVENDRLKQKNKKLKALRKLLGPSPIHQKMKAKIERLTADKRQSTRQSMTYKDELDAARIALENSRNIIRRNESETQRLRIEMERLREELEDSRTTIKMMKAAFVKIEEERTSAVPSHQHDEEQNVNSQHDVKQKRKKIEGKLDKMQQENHDDRRSNDHDTDDNGSATGSSSGTIASEPSKVDGLDSHESHEQNNRRISCYQIILFIATVIFAFLWGLYCR